MPIDHWPMLYAAFCLLDKITNGALFDAALEEVCAQLSLNHVQRGVLTNAYRMLCGERWIEIHEPHHSGFRLG